MAAVVVALLLLAPDSACTLVIAALVVWSVVEFTKMTVAGPSKLEMGVVIWWTLMAFAVFFEPGNVLDGLFRFITYHKMEDLTLSYGDGKIRQILSSAIRAPAMDWPMTLFGTGFFLVLTQFARRGEIQESLPRLFALFFGVFYVAVPLGFLNLILLKDRDVLFWVLAVTFLSDTVAYFFGKKWGRAKLAPRISPGKTWAGFVGSLVGGALGSVLLLSLNSDGRDIASSEVLIIPVFVLMGAGVAVFGVLGDLTESFIKRGMGVKDSGTLIPGHGGILDRIDGLLFTAPITYAFFYFWHDAATVIRVLYGQEVSP